jgi:glycosyltransferase involved in cell wall biosynthesis
MLMTPIQPSMPRQTSAPQTSAPRCDIAVFIRALEGGGAQRDAVLLANALATTGRAITIITLKPDGNLAALVDPGVPIVKIEAGNLRSCVAALRRVIMTVNPTVLLSSEAAQNVVTAFAVATLPRKVRPKLVLREVASPSHARRHDPYLQNRLAYRALGLACRQADCVITLTRGAKTDLTDNFGVPAEKIRALGSNAVIDDATLGRLAAWDGDTGRVADLIVAIGRLSPEKDHLTLIEAMALLPSGHPARLVIVGEGPQRSVLEARIATLGLGPRVTLAGFTPDPFAWQMRASLHVCSSRFEGLGNAIIEALACGTPVVSTDCPYGPREILSDGRFGLIVPVADPRALADAIVKALPSPPDRASLKARAMAYTTKSAAQAFTDALYHHRLLGPVVASRVSKM